MGNYITEDEIIKLLEEGWTIRQKKRKKWKYISIRKGNKEKSLGRYDEEKYAELKNLEKTIKEPSSKMLAQKEEEEQTIKIHQELEESRRRIKEFEDDLQLHRGLFKTLNCIYKHEGYCTFWTWNVKPVFKDYESIIFKIEYKKMKISKTGGEVWLIKATSQFCKFCSVFKKREVK
jgi:hypothetical protein